MVTVHRAFGVRFVIFPNDHSPPHVHAFTANGEAKIELAPLALVLSAGIGRTEMRRIIDEVKSRRTELLAEWRRIHG